MEEQEKRELIQKTIDRIMANMTARTKKRRNVPTKDPEGHSEPVPKKSGELSPKGHVTFFDKDRDLRRRQEQELRQMQRIDRLTGRSGPNTIVITKRWTYP